MHFSIINQVLVSTLDLPGFMGLRQVSKLGKLLNTEPFSDLNCCSRSNNQKFAVTGDDFGKIKLYSYPVTQPKVRFFLANLQQEKLPTYILSMKSWFLTGWMLTRWAFDQKHDKVPICYVNMKCFYQDLFECNTVFRACIMRLVATVPKWPGWNFWLMTTDCCQRADETRPLCSGKWPIKQLSQNPKSTSN